MTIPTNTTGATPEKPETPPRGPSGVTPPSGRRVGSNPVSEPVIYDENGRLRLELPAPPDDHRFYPVTGAVLQGFVDQVNELRAERDRLKATALIRNPEIEIPAEEIEELMQRINRPHPMIVLPPDPPSDRDDWPTQQQWAAFCGGSDPDESAHLDLFDDPAEAEEIAAWLKGGQVAARQVAYGPWTKPYQPGDMDRAEAANTAVAPCCDLHNTNCEPPADLCCHQCTEAGHPHHPNGARCVLSLEERP
jgi:hypothetical protein